MSITKERASEILNEGESDRQRRHREHGERQPIPQGVALEALSGPQRRALAYYHRTMLPKDEKRAALKSGRGLGSPDPRTTWWLLDRELIERVPGDRLNRYRPTERAAATAKRLFLELCMKGRNHG